jgi:hypothetical protein
MWVFEDEFHPITAPKALSGRGTFHFVAEWMERALSGKIEPGHTRRRFIHANGDGLYD